MGIFFRIVVWKTKSCIQVVLEIDYTHEAWHATNEWSIRFFKKLVHNNVLLAKTPTGRLVIEFKNCCLKKYENCGLKNDVEIRVFSVYKTKKCVWYHDLNNMFQC